MVLKLEIHWNNLAEGLRKYLSFIPAQLVCEERWFGDRPETSIFVVDLEVVKNFENEALVFFFVKFEDDERYAFMPIILQKIASFERIEAQVIIIGEDFQAEIRDASNSDLYASEVAEGIFCEKRIGHFYYKRILPSIFNIKSFKLAETSNSISYVISDFVIKTSRHATLHKALETELINYMIDRGFENVARMFGEILYKGYSLATCQEYIPNAKSLWDIYVEKLNMEIKPVDSFSTLIADMHLAMEGFTHLSAGSIVNEYLNLIDILSSKLYMIDSFNFDVNKVIPKLLTFAPLYEKYFLEEFIGKSHGDLHLGQILLSGDKLYVVDFEGEPIPLDLVDSPLKDIASMIRSFSYVRAYVSEDEKWDRVMAENLCKEYYQAAKAKGLVAMRNCNELDFLRMVMLFELEKCIKEIIYEIDHRPHMVSIPSESLIDIIERLEGINR